MSDNIQNINQCPIIYLKDVLSGKKNTNAINCIKHRYSNFKISSKY